MTANLNANHALERSMRRLPLELAAKELGVPSAVVTATANLGLFPTTVDASGQRVANLCDVAFAVCKVLGGVRQ